MSDYEINLRDKNNSQRTCSIVMIAIKDEQGIPLKFTGSMRDIFIRKQAEKERKDLCRNLWMQPNNSRRDNRRVESNRADNCIYLNHIFFKSLCLIFKREFV